MREYRAYLLGIDSHRFMKVAEFATDHRDDAAAMEAARRLVDGYDVELWESTRLVVRFRSGKHPKTLKEFTIDHVSSVPGALIVEVAERTA